jgi:hypothetical protein
MVVSAVLGALARLRGGKSVHPHGVVYAARLEIEGTDAAPPESALLSEPREWQALVRFSRSVGLPRPAPDLLGVSIRIVGGHGEGHHQDLMLVSSFDLPVLHHIFVPAGDVQRRPYSSSLPYRAGGRSFLVGLLPDPRSPRPDGEDEFVRLERAAGTGDLRFQLAVAAPMGRFERVGVLKIGEKMPDILDALRFNPFNAGPGLRPSGRLNEWRRRAYRESQQGWGQGERAAAQRQADEVMDAFARGAGTADE